MKRLFIYIAIAALTTIPATVKANIMSGITLHSDGYHFRELNKLIELASNRLDLSENQINTIELICWAHLPRLTTYAKKFQSERENYDRLVRKDSLDLVSLQNQIITMNQARGNWLLEVGQFRNKLRSVLTEEQKSRVDERHAEQRSQFESFLTSHLL